MTPEEIADAIKKIVVGLIISEYGLMLLKDVSKQDLKFRTSNAIAAIRRVQDYFLHHPESKPEHKEIFKKEFLKNEIVLISELMTTVWGLGEDAIDEIITAIKSNITEEV